MSIPIQNIYYMLGYAWNTLAQSEKVDVSKLESSEMVDLLATVLSSGTSALLRRGLDRSYQEYTDELNTIRGRVNLGESARSGKLKRARAVCSFDELSYDVLHNQIIKSSLMRLVRVPRLDQDLKLSLIRLYRRMPGVSEVPLTIQAFSKLQLHRNNAFYRFLLNICRLVVECVLIDERTGEYVFVDFLRDEKKMAVLFEKFVLNFYAQEQSDYKPKVEMIKWDAVTQTEHDADMTFLPGMKTDITLRSSHRTIVIDTKYYKETLTRGRFGAPKVNSGNLYQLFAYLSNMERSDDPNDANAGGMLLYPDTTGNVDLAYKIKGHDVRIRTINLDQHWKGIKEDMLMLLP